MVDRYFPAVFAAIRQSCTHCFVRGEGDSPHTHRTWYIVYVDDSVFRSLCDTYSLALYVGTAVPYGRRYVMAA